MSNRRKITIYIALLLVIVLLIIKINIPCRIYQLPFLYGIIHNVEQTEIPAEMHLNKDDELFEIRKAFIDFSSYKAELSLCIHAQNQDDIINLIVAEVSDYLVNHPNAFLNKCRIDIFLFDMGREVIKACNYSSDGNINNKPYTFIFVSEE
ncbi:MAG: hypothetical protein E7508_09210 [Ruminococcus sp.]|nr:hypothetical protein [Ruminococcus sp.]